ncbi:hypothetical protein L5515_011129 [Caenorhabditis briggsae]|uniref:Uncharacterized protein n=1 Tax=Caenorhabditis briggsae TaxID=6238 RepID=A0AAE9JE14_CAEBR|nr:hypothetical protein L5515_011129 [Caenorhabditis briggsae]
MSENSIKLKNLIIFCVLAVVVVTLIAYGFRLDAIGRREKALARKIEYLEKITDVIAESIAIQPKIGHESPHFFDTPNQFPRMSKVGVFPMHNIKFEHFVTEGRKNGDMKDVAVLIESTNKNDTQRLITSLMSQRMPEDLQIFLFTPTNISGVSYKLLKSWVNKTSKAVALNDTDRRSAASRIFGIHRKDYIITLIDYQHIGDDFTDFFFTGKRAMEIDSIIHGVCGHGNDVWQDRNLGDVLWLTDSPCWNNGWMFSRSFMKRSHNLMMIRPEVSRVGHSQRSVTQDSSWNIDLFNPLLIRHEEFLQRFHLDLSHSKKMKLSDWDFLEDLDFRTIYRYPYESDDDLKMYFRNSNIQKLYMFRKIIPISIDHRRAYIVPKNQMDHY